MQEITYAYAPITKVDKVNRKISGPISGPNNVDLDQQIVDVDFLRAAAPEWMRFGNIREQHDPSRAIGKALELNLDTEDGVPEITAYIVDTDAWNKIEAGVYSGFSVGIKNAQIIRDSVARNGRIVGGTLVEVSTVDHPCNTNAKFAICKMVGGSGWYDMQDNTLIEPEGQSNKLLLESEVYKRFYSAEERRDMPKEDFAGPHESFPIKTQEDVHNAFELAGHADDPDAVRSKIKEIARRKGFSLPKADEDDADKEKQLNPDDTKAGKMGADEGEERDDDEREDDAGDNDKEERDAAKAGSPEFTYESEHYHGASKHMHAHKGEDHTHCRMCGADDRVCGHIKSRMGKDANPDTTKDAPGSTPSGDFMDGESHIETPHQAPAALTMRRGIETLLSEVKGRLDALATEVETGLTADPERNPTDAAFANAISTPERAFGNGTMFDSKLKDAVADILKDILPDMVQRELSKAFGTSDLVTKGATPDTVKQVISDLAKSAADAAVEPLLERVNAVEEMVPVHGISNTQDVAKRFALNRDKAPSLDELTKAAQELPEDQRHTIAVELIKAAQTNPIKLFER